MLPRQRERPRKHQGTFDIECISVYCPVCETPYVDTSDGSIFITRESNMHGGDIVMCESCASAYRIPFVQGVTT